ncbi:MAG: transglycosylase SLT domain-containing protein [Ktedonobacterales bacterium]
MTDLFARLMEYLQVLKQRRWMFAGLAAVSVLLIVSSLLIIIGLSPRQTVSSDPTTVPATTTATATTLATVTPLPTPTHTVTPVPVQNQPISVVQAPPPPPVPTAPPNPPTPTVQVCPTPTAFPTPTPTDTPLPSPTATSTGTAGATATSATTATTGSALLIANECQQCPYYSGNNPSQSEISSALDAAADLYQLPRNLLLAVAWQESQWHEDVTSCDGGIGLMQIQYYTYPWLNSQSVPECGLSTTNYDPTTLAGNADLGAKFLAWLSCFYSYWGNNGGSSLSDPGIDTIDWYYQQAALQYPDTLNSDGSPNPNSLCAAIFNDPNNPEYAALPSTTSDPWSCPYSATAGDATLLDFTLSAYNEGPTYTDENGIQNWSYVDGVEGYIPEFASGSLPG